MKILRITLAVFLFTSLLMAQDAPQPPSPQDGPGQGERRVQFRGLAGTIAAINGDTLSIKGMGGREFTVKTTDKTEFRKEGQPAKLADFKVGDMVMVRPDGPPAAPDAPVTAMAISSDKRMMQMGEGLGKVFIVGEVKAIDLDNLKITVLRPDNQTQVIGVDENTSFRKRRESITMSDIKVGDNVMGRGALKDGTFIASELNVGMAGQRMMMMGPGGERQGPPPQPPQAPQPHQ